MNRRGPLLFLFLFCVISRVVSQQSWILPLDSPLYKQVEELFLTQGKVPPLEETPVIADELKNHLDCLVERSQNRQIIERAGKIKKDLVLPFPHLSPILELGLSAGFNSETNRDHYIESSAARGGQFLDYMSMYEINEIPPIAKFGFIAQAAGFSLLFQPELNESISSKLEDYDWISVPFELIAIDNNFPFRGIASFYHPPVEFRFGRDKLNLGPGKWSTLTLTRHMPYFDYAKARFFLEGFSISWYLIRLNPTITEGEGEYLQDLYDTGTNPEPNAPMNGKPFIERSKHYIIGRLCVTPFDWLSFSVAQTNLVGGRNPELTDFNPLIIFHNLYAEGTYSVPLSITATVVPYRGIKLYFDYLFYDAAVGDEKDPSVNPSAMAYQVGLTFLSDPFFTLFGGRFRFDAEFSFVDPWVYGKYYSLRQFTSRLIYVEHFVGRSWVDYPLGFYLGPDSLELNLCLAYGIPGEREVELWYNRRGRGEVNLSGFGDENDYLHAGEPGYPLKGSPTGTAEWTDQIQLSFHWVPVHDLMLSTWYRIKSVTNRYNEAGENFLFHYIGMSGIWKIF
jgi:hypothetical protein